VSVANFAAVLFDWRGTLVMTRSVPQWIREALGELGRPCDAGAVDAVRHRLKRARSVPAVASRWAAIDTSAELHRDTYRLLFDEAGIDPQLADTMYAIESDPFGEPLAADAISTLAALRGAGIGIGIVSDIHFDLRPRAEREGFNHLVDSWVLSFERGTQKPDLAMFSLALTELAVPPDRALMVGDRAGYDGAAVGAGIPTLLIPPIAAVSERRLHLVLSACGLAIE
jgi:FMN phosphatase YigB (HAD superfamily)